MANGETLNAAAQDNPVGNVKFIYIIRNKINDKVYIGQTKNPQRRFSEHIQRKHSRNVSVIEQAIQKYGAKNFYYEILEEPTANYNEREKYWISFFNSVSPNGYNVLAGGEDPPIRRGTTNNKSKITKDDMKEIRQLLLNRHVTLNEIARAFNVSSHTISNLNSGFTYFNPETHYPIRDFRCPGEIEQMVSSETIDKIIDDLRQETMSMRQIAIKHGVSCKQVSGINNGDGAYRRKELKYPVRTSTRLTKPQESGIKSDLLNGVLSKHQIATKYRVSYECVSNINAGRSFFDDELSYPLKKHEGRYDYSESLFEKIRLMLKNGVSPKKICSKLNIPNISFVYDINKGISHRSPNYSYPIQKSENKFSKEFISELTREIATQKKSLSEIAKKYGLNKSSVIAIKNGAWIKYRLPGVTYPLRPNNYRYSKCTNPVSTISAKESRTTIDTSSERGVLPLECWK